MIYLFTGNSSYLISKQIIAWKNLFIQKHWEFNLIHIKNISEYENSFFAENITAAWFMWEKKLVIIDIESEKNEKYENKLNHIIDISKNTPESNILIFAFANPDKRSKVYKTISAMSEIKEFNSWNEEENKNNILNKYNGQISITALNKLIQYKQNNLEKIISEIDKLLINFEYIEIKHIEENIIPELEESIFQIIDDILNLNLISAVSKIRNSSEQSSIYLLYNSLLSNLRVNIYILFLKDKKTDQNKISDILKLWNRWFLVNKNYKISLNKLLKIYNELIEVDSKIKTWMLLWSDESDIELEIEKILLKNN